MHMFFSTFIFTALFIESILTIISSTYVPFLKLWLPVVIFLNTFMQFYIRETAAILPTVWSPNKTEVITNISGAMLVLHFLHNTGSNWIEGVLQGGCWLDQDFIPVIIYVLSLKCCRYIENCSTCIKW